MTFIVSQSQDFQKTLFSLDLNHSGRFFFFFFLNPYLHNYDLEQPGYTENCSTILNKYINKQCTFWNILYFVYFWSSLGKEKGFRKFFCCYFFFKLNLTRTVCKSSGYFEKMNTTYSKSIKNSWICSSELFKLTLLHQHRLWAKRGCASVSNRRHHK